MAVKIGATGKFPKGRLNEGDEGELRMAVTSDPVGKRVIMQFGKSVSWIGLTPEDAMVMASMLSKHAARAGGLTKDVPSPPVEPVDGTQRKWVCCMSGKESLMVRVNGQWQCQDCGHFQERT